MKNIIYAKENLKPSIEIEKFKSALQLIIHFILNILHKEMIL